LPGGTFLGVVSKRRSRRRGRRQALNLLSKNALGFLGLGDFNEVREEVVCPSCL